jgi:hypothetical protein
VLPRLGLGRRRVGGSFVVQGDRVGIDDPGLFEREPARMLELFRLAQEREIDVHPGAVAAVARNLGRIDQSVREDPEANRLFLEMLCSPKDPALTLGRMSEAGLLGRFIPDFGRVVGQTQHDLYHIYTVDEHTIRAVGNLHQIERGELADELPIATEVMPKLLSRRELRVALFLHDLGKARGGNHSEVGERIAERLCPRLGLTDDATETVAWLVRHHLVMSNIAFRRDTEDPKTIADFVAVVQSPERLKLLLVLTVCDIRAVGPGCGTGGRASSCASSTSRLPRPWPRATRRAGAPPGSAPPRSAWPRRSGRRRQRRPCRRRRAAPVRGRPGRARRSTPTSPGTTRGTGSGSTPTPTSATPGSCAPPTPPERRSPSTSGSTSSAPGPSSCSTPPTTRACS